MGGLLFEHEFTGKKALGSRCVTHGVHAKTRIVGKERFYCVSLEVRPQSEKSFLRLLKEAESEQARGKRP